MLAAMKLGAVVIPATTLLAETDLRDRIDRGNAQHVSCGPPTRQVRRRPGRYTRIAVGGGARAGSTTRRGRGAGGFVPDGRPRAPTHCCCTSPPARPRGPSSSSTPTRPIPSGTLDDVLARPEARRRAPEPLLAGMGQARVEQPLRALARRGDGRDLQLRALRRRGAARVLANHEVTTMCAPPTVWRMLIQADLGSGRPGCARSPGGRAAQPGGDRTGENAWGLTIRDGYGQTETTRRSATRPASRSRRARWAGRCPATRSPSSTPSPASRGARARSACHWPTGRSV